MTKLEIDQFLKLIDAKNVKDGHGWTIASCPLAPWKHQGKLDKRPSFGVRIVNDGESVWSCFTCSPTPQPMFNLLQNIWRLSGRFPREASSFLMAANKVVLQPHAAKTLYKDKWSNLLLPQKNYIPEDVIEMFPVLNGCSTSAPISDYLTQTRGISEEVLERFGIRCDAERKLIVFPYTFPSGEICTLQARRIDEKQLFSITAKFVGQPWLKFDSPQARGAWFGLHLIDWKQPVYIVEGALDAMRLATLGKLNVLGAGTCHISKEQFRTLCGLNYKIGFDSDEAGMDGARKAANHLKNVMGVNRVSILNWDIVGCKDPGELSNTGQVAEVVGLAKLV